MTDGHPDTGVNPEARAADTAPVSGATETAAPKSGGSRFRWSRGGWFGGQVGATLWLLVLGGALLAQGRTVGVAVLGLALAANVAGCVLWARRDRLEAYPAIQMLIAICGAAALVSVLLAGFTGGAGGEDDPTPSLLALLVYPGLMLVFWLQERSARGSGD